MPGTSSRFRSIIFVAAGSLPGVRPVSSLGVRRPIVARSRLNFFTAPVVLPFCSFSRFVAVGCGPFASPPCVAGSCPGCVAVSRLPRSAAADDYSVRALVSSCPGFAAVSRPRLWCRCAAVDNYSVRAPVCCVPLVYSPPGLSPPPYGSSLNSVAAGSLRPGGIMK